VLSGHQKKSWKVQPKKCKLSFWRLMGWENMSWDRKQVVQMGNRQRARKQSRSRRNRIDGVLEGPGVASGKFRRSWSIHLESAFRVLIHSARDAFICDQSRSSPMELYLRPQLLPQEKAPTESNLASFPQFSFYQRRMR
jgi:hypothetical protein